MLMIIGKKKQAQILHDIQVMSTIANWALCHIGADGDDVSDLLDKYTTCEVDLVSLATGIAGIHAMIDFLEKEIKE